MKPPIIKVPDPAPGSGGGMDFQVRLPDKLTETAVPVAAVFFFNAAADDDLPV
jgi:hypothetical protein